MTGRRFDDGCIYVTGLKKKKKNILDLKIGHNKDILLDQVLEKSFF